MHPTPGRRAANPASERSSAHGPAEGDLPPENSFGRVWDRAVGGKAPEPSAPTDEQSSSEPLPSVSESKDTVAFADPVEPADAVGLAPSMPVLQTLPPSAPIGSLSMPAPPVQGPLEPASSAPQESPSAAGQPVATDKTVLTPISPRPAGETLSTGPNPVPDGRKTEGPEPGKALPEPAPVVRPSSGVVGKPSIGPEERPAERKSSPPGPEPARIAVPKGAGTAGSAQPEMSRAQKENFLNSDNQKVNNAPLLDGIGDAMSGTRMRRPQENRNPMTASLNLNARLVDGSLALASSQSRMGALVRNPVAGVETEAPEIDFATRETRAVSGLSTAEARSGQSVATQTLQAPRQAEAASVLESVHRMAEQASARAQDRLSMTLRFDDGSSVRIRLSREGGEFHTVIHTDQPGMETALRQQWSQFSQDAADRGLKFLSMAFADLGGSADQHRSSNHNNEQGEFADLVAGVPTAHPSTAPIESDSQGPSRSSITSPSGSGRLRAWV